MAAVKSSLTIQPATTHRTRILVVDDSLVVRVKARTTLQQQFDVALAEDGLEAWGTLNNDETISVVLTDLSMPNLDGYQLIQRIRHSHNERIRDLPIIVITGEGEDEAIRRRVFDIGATDFIGKPFKDTEILARVEAHASYFNVKENFKKSANIDLLTGGLNRKGIDEKLDSSVSFANRHKLNLAVVIFEIDDFKSINGNIGKQSSEKILKHVADILSAAIRKEDSFGYYEYARFVSILPMANTESMVEISKRLCNKVNQTPTPIGHERISVTLSAGISTVHAGTPTTTNELIEAAETALSDARELGGGQVLLSALEGDSNSANSISIDSVLNSITYGKSALDAEQISAIQKRLAPLLALLPKSLL